MRNHTNSRMKVVNTRQSGKHLFPNSIFVQILVPVRCEKSIQGERIRGCQIDQCDVTPNLQATKMLCVLTCFFMGHFLTSINFTDLSHKEMQFLFHFVNLQHNLPIWTRVFFMTITSMLNTLQILFCRGMPLLS